MDDYDQLYAGTAHYFGHEPASILRRLGDRIPAGGRVLDVGTGQGRNALPLAQGGCRVTGIDPSARSIHEVGDRGRRAGLTLDLWCGGFEAYQAPAPFDAVLVLGLVQMLAHDDIATLGRRLSDWTATGGLLFLTAWHTGDPRLESLNASAEGIGPNSFRLDSGAVRTYLEPDQILTLVPDWEPVHHWEGLGPVHRHGDGPEEQHGVIELVARRPA